MEVDSAGALQVALSLLEDDGMAQASVDDPTMQSLKRICDGISDPCAALLCGPVKYAEACRQQSLKSTSVA